MKHEIKNDHLTSGMKLHNKKTEERHSKLDTFIIKNIDF